MQPQDASAVHAHERPGSSTTPPMVAATSGPDTSVPQQEPVADTSSTTAGPSKTSSTTRKEIRSRPRTGKPRKHFSFEIDERFEAKVRLKELEERRQAALATYPREGYLGLPLGAFPDEETFRLKTRDRADVLAKVKLEDVESTQNVDRLDDAVTQERRMLFTEQQTRSSPRPDATTLQYPSHTFGAQADLFTIKRGGHWVESNDRIIRVNERPEMERPHLLTGEAQDKATAEGSEPEPQHADQRTKIAKREARREFMMDSQRVRSTTAAAIDSIKNILAEERLAESKLIQEALQPRKHRTTYRWPVHETLLSDPTRHTGTSSAKPPDAYEEKGIAFVDSLMGKPPSSIGSEHQLSTKAKKADRRTKRKRRSEEYNRGSEDGSTQDMGKEEEEEEQEAPQTKKSSRDTYPVGIIKVRSKVEDLSALHERKLSKEEQTRQWELDRHAERRAPEVHQMFEEEVIAFAQRMYRQGSAFRIEDFDTLQELTMPKYRIQAVRSSKPTRTRSRRSGATSSNTTLDTRNEGTDQALEHEGADEARDDQEWADDELTAMQEKAAVFSAEDTMRRVLQRLPYVIRQGALGYKPTFVNGDFERRWETILLAANLGGVEERILKKVSLRMTNLLSTAQQLRYLAVRTKKPPTFEEYHQQLAQAKEDLKLSRAHEIVDMIRDIERVDEFYETEGEQYKKDMYLNYLWEQQDQWPPEQGSQEPPQHEDDNDEGRDDSVLMQESRFKRMSQPLQEQTTWSEQAMPDPLHPSNDYGELVMAAEARRQQLENDLADFASRWT
ncbi:hypothetical protein BGZ73_007336 [Actinomortierella ambigua]|nr:hypothetical protein BGZ73_007336 [Actinomortierella ambigua]